MTVAQLPDDPRAVSDEVTYEGFDDQHIILQRRCPDCSGGLLYAPVRYHGACGGSGLLVRTLPVVSPEEPDHA